MDRSDAAALVGLAMTPTTGRPDDRTTGGVTANHPIVLLVDDEPPIVHAVVRLLAFEPVEVVTAGSGDEALQVLRERAVAVILTDQHMPGMRGVELLRQARELAPEASRILFSGHIDVELLRAAVNGGEVYRFVAKPWDDDELIHAIRQGVERWELLARSRVLATEARARADAVLAAGSAALDAHGSAAEAALALLDAMPIAALAIDAGGAISLLNMFARTAFPACLPGHPVSGAMSDDLVVWLMAGGGGERTFTTALGPLRCESLDLGSRGVALLGVPVSNYPEVSDLP